MKIQVLGSGCPTCKKLYEITQKAVSEMGIKGEVEYLTGAEGTQAIIEMGIMSSPVLVVNGSPVMVGFTSNIEKIKRLLSEAK
jgi:small redox-active disulfide protein 2